jgi:hypothetical protein
MKLNAYLIEMQPHEGRSPDEPLNARKPDAG